MCTFLYVWYYSPSYSHSYLFCIKQSKSVSKCFLGMMNLLLRLQQLHPNLPPLPLKMESTQLSDPLTSVLYSLPDVRVTWVDETSIVEVWVVQAQLAMIRILSFSPSVHEPSEAQRKCWFSLMIPWKNGTHSLFLLTSQVTRRSIIVPSKSLEFIKPDTSSLWHPVPPSTSTWYDPIQKAPCHKRKSKWLVTPRSVEHLSTITQKFRVAFPWKLSMSCGTGRDKFMFKKKDSLPISFWCQQVRPCEYVGVEFAFKWPEDALWIYFLRWMLRKLFGFSYASYVKDTFHCSARI